MFNLTKEKRGKEDQESREEMVEEGKETGRKISDKMELNNTKQVQ